MLGRPDVVVAGERVGRQIFFDNVFVADAFAAAELVTERGAVVVGAERVAELQLALSVGQRQLIVVVNVSRFLAELVRPGCVGRRFGFADELPAVGRVDVAKLQPGFGFVATFLEHPIL